jgi:menaquinone-dependent protoporphyrinogen oxidase
LAGTAWRSHLPGFRSPPGPEEEVGTVKVLVAYASKHGATAGIAERIAKTLAAAGYGVDVRPVTDIRDVSAYDAFVLGSATYLGHWRKEATAFVRDNRSALATRPVWLFSSGPIGTKKTDEQGEDLRTVSEPTELPSLVMAIQPRQHRVFFGALDPAKLTFPERTMRKLPGGRELLPEGDFRDWADVDTWADEIADQLA